MKLIALTITLLALTIPAVAAVKPLMQCGPFAISSSDDGFAHINNDRPKTQKVTFLGAKDDYSKIKYEWVVESSKDGQLYGLEYIKRNGKAFINAQILQASMDAQRTYGTFDCRKIS